MPSPGTLSYVDYVASGTTANFGVTFPYLERNDVSVTVNGVAAAFSWLSDSILQLAAVPANGAAVRVSRTTPIDQPKVDFADGSTLSEADLNESDKQNLYAIQELKEQVQSLQLQLQSLLLLAGNLPAVTTADNGKVLQVVSGVWTLVATSTQTVVDDVQVDGTAMKVQKKTIPLVVIGSPTASAWTDVHTGTGC